MDIHMHMDMECGLWGTNVGYGRCITGFWGCCIDYGGVWLIGHGCWGIDPGAWDMHDGAGRDRAGLVIGQARDHVYRRAVQCAYT